MSDPVLLPNSTRRMYKATYEPRLLGPESERPMAVEKASVLRALAVKSPELTAVTRRIQSLPATDARVPALTRLRDVANRLARDSSSRATMDAAREVAQVPTAVVAEFGGIIASGRAAGAREAAGLVANMSHGYASAQPAAGTSTPPAALSSVLVWGSENDAGRSTRLANLAGRFGMANVGDLAQRLSKVAEDSASLLDAFLQRTRVSPVGWLHLERVEMTPAGVEQGEIVHSITLAPNETVNISHREWSLRSEEFERIVQDVFEGFSEEGVAEKHDVSMSTESQSRHATAFSLNASASGLGVSVSSSFSDQRDESRSRKDSVQHSMEVTRKASSRSRKEHKVSFKVTTVAGEEDHAVRVIANPAADKAMRVDHYRMMRKWQVDLYRYAVRMTYDLVIPSPGADLMRRQRELRELEGKIARSFVFNLDPSSITVSNWAQLATQHGAQIPPPPQVIVPLRAPPATRSGITNHDEVKTVHIETIAFEVPDGYQVAAAELRAFVQGWPEVAGPGFFVLGGYPVPTVGQQLPDYRLQLEHLKNKTGRLTVEFFWVGVTAYSVNVDLMLLMLPAAFAKWQTAAWAAIRDAALARYEQERQDLERQRERLLESLAATDTLTLRKIEREQVMKGVLRWLFGPQFELVPDDVAAILAAAEGHESGYDPHKLDEQEWLRILRFGEWIKFLHHAIEWENVLYFLYPYFWDRPDLWDDKQDINHPDPIHRDFLRAGSARVVLTIRPGFEDTFARIVELGTFDVLPGSDHPYVTIGEELRAYADANYPFLPPANPDNNERSEKGQLAGTWFEYTPSSAMDIAVTQIPVTAG